MTDYYGTHGGNGGLGWGDTGTGLYWSIDGDELPSSTRFKTFATGPPLLALLPDTGIGETAGTIYGGWRRGSGSQAQDSNDVDPPGPNPGLHWRIEYTDINVRSEFPTNAGNGWGTFDDPGTGLDHDGTQWGMRSYGLSEGLFLRVDTQDIFGKGSDGTVWTTGEGHAMYNTISPEAGKTIALTDCTSTNCGGHGFYFTSAYDGTQRWPSLNPLRGGRALQPELGGFLNFTNCHATNTDQSPARGAYAFNFPDTFSTITLDACSVTYSIPGGFKKNEDFLNSRAAVSCKGTCGGLYIINGCNFVCPDPSDRTNQISCRGPDFVELRDSNFDCSAISINNHFNLSPYEKMTERLTISNCTGRAAVFFNDEYIGQIDALNGDWFQPFPRPFYSNPA